MTVDPVLDIFPFGSPPFGRLVSEFRRRIIEEAVAADLPGLVFTYVWALEDERDLDTVASYVDIVESGGGRVTFVELAAPLDERLVRNASDFRLEQKRSKRDLAFSHQNVIDLDSAWVMNTGGAPTVAEGYLEGRDYVRIDNTHRPAADVARQVVEAFGLPRHQ